MKSEKDRRPAVVALIDRLRHEGIGEDEVYQELADRLMVEHLYNRVFNEVFGRKRPADVEAEHLRRFYEDFREGVYDDDGGPES